MPFAPRSILWPTDLSPYSLLGARYACEMCRTYGARLHAVYVAPFLVPDSTAAIASAGDMLVGTGDIRPTAETQLRALVQKHISGVPEVVQTVLIGTPWRELCDYAKQSKIDLIVSATHGETGLKHVLMGSVAERLVQHAECPVLIVKSFST